MPTQTSGTEIGRFVGAPVRVTRGFLATAAILYILTGAWTLGWIGLLAWIPLVAGSILAHEAGHAVVAKANNQRITEIALTWSGGHCTREGIKAADIDFRVALAGPAASIGLATALWVATWLPLGPLGAVAALGSSLNFSWALFNLIPIPPLDGGHALSALARRR